jgi:hypothetical protein
MGSDQADSDIPTRPGTGPADETPIDRPAAARDFDFLLGVWRVRHRRLSERLAGCSDWTEFETDHECGHILGGLGNIDRQWGEFAGAYYEGVTIRSFAADPAHPRGGEWLIYWMDTGNPAPAFQVRGNFAPGREGGQSGEAGESGEFLGAEEVDGTAFQLRFRWWRLAPGRARWDQAFRLPDSDQWEVNWVMEFERVE